MSSSGGSAASSENNPNIFGFSIPASPPKSYDSNGLEKVMLSSSTERKMDADSSGSTSGTVKPDLPVNPSSKSAVYLAAAALSKNDRSDAIHEREKNQNLLTFISALGYTSSSVNDFLKTGSVPNLPETKLLSVGLEEGEIIPSSVPSSSPPHPVIPPPSTSNPDSAQSKSWCDILTGNEPKRVALSYFPPSPSEIMKE